MLNLKIPFKKVGKKVERKLLKFIKSDDVITQFKITNHLGDVNLYVIRKQNEIITMFRQNPYGKKYVNQFKYCEKTKQLNPLFSNSSSHKIISFY